MDNKDTHDLIIGAFGPSECRICHRMGSQVVAFPCTQVEDLSSEHQTSRELAQDTTSTDIDKDIVRTLETITAILSGTGGAANVDSGRVIEIAQTYIRTKLEVIHG